MARAHEFGGIAADFVLRQETPGQLALGGGVVVYTLRRVVDGDERIELWSVPFAGGEPGPLVAGPGVSHCPRIDPSGTRVAYLHAEYDGRARICIVPLSGGAPRLLHDFPRGATDLAWAPDGESLVVLAEDDTSDRVVRGDGLAAGSSPTAFRLTTIDWRADGEPDGGLRLYPRQLHRLPLDGSDPVRLTAGPWSASRPRVDRDGGIYFLADVRPGADLEPCPQVQRIDADGGGLCTVTDFAGGVVRFHIDGARMTVLAVNAQHRPDSAPPRWFLFDIATLGPDRATSVYDAALGNAHLWTGLLGDETDLHEWHLELDDCATVTTRSSRGSTMPIAVSTGASLTTARGVCGAIAAEDQQRVAVLCLGESFLNPSAERRGPDIYALEAGGPRRLTDHGLRWRGLPESSGSGAAGESRADGSVGDALSAPAVAAKGAPAVAAPWPAAELRELDVPGPSGPISVFVLDPPQGTACRATIIDIHGGPTGQWAVVPPLEAILLAYSGFRVAMPNIRGSIDRGALWVAGLGGAWGEADVADILVVVDALVNRELAEPGNIGVMGLSYGGFLTQYLIGVTDRFAAAVAENGVTNQISAWGASDLGPSYNLSAGLADPLTITGANRLWRASPLKHVSAIRTPLLILQGGDDRTCPASDNEQLFVALRTLRRTVEYVIYPEESHLMQATARIDRRIDRHQRVLAWFDAHLARGAAA